MFYGHASATLRASVPQDVSRSRMTMSTQASRGAPPLGLPRSPRARSRARPIVVCVIVTLVVLAIADSVAAEWHRAHTPPFCIGSGTINTEAINGPVDLTSCPIEGRELVHSLGDGYVGGGVAVPPPGSTVENVSLTSAGDYTLTATTDSTGHLTVTETSPTVGATASRTPTKGRHRHRGPRAHATSDSACSEGEYNLDENGRWFQTYYWYYNSSTEGPGITYALDNIRAGINNMINGINNCGYAENTWSANAAYQGDVTGTYANVNAAGDCTDKFPDGKNTVSWEDFTDPRASSCDLSRPSRFWRIHRGRYSVRQIRRTHKQSTVALLQRHIL
jgi:hypothetical protein